MRRLERLLEWTAREAEEGLLDALDTVRRAAAPQGVVPDPSSPQVETRSADLRTTGGADRLPPLREGWVVAAGEQAFPEGGDGAEDPPGELGSEEGPWTS